ncbi:MAG: hypothetical protein IJ465_01555, partial [Clostridia bacterium]|nr:hypothetical protein [Clostridia bacterium]
MVSRKHILKGLSLCLAVLVLAMAVLTITTSANGSTSTNQKSAATTNATYSNDGRHVDVGYLLRENFFYTNSLIGTSGWETANLDTGSITNLITDSSLLEASYMTRNFIPQTDKTVTLEFRLIPLQPISGGEIKLRSGDDDAVTLSLENEKIWYNLPNGNKMEIAPFDYSRWMGIKLVCDIANNEVLVFADGHQITEEPVAFSAAATTIDNIFFGIDEIGTGSYSLGYVYIYTGYALYEDLISAAVTNDSSLDGNLNLNGTGRATDANAVVNNSADIGKALDGNPDTSWEANTGMSKAFNFAVEYNNQIKKINKVIIYAPTAGIKTNFGVTYRDASGTWRSVEAGGTSGYTTMGTKDAPTVLTFNKTVYCDTLALMFYDDESAPIDFQKISEFEAYFEDDGSASVEPIAVPDDWDYSEAGGTVEVTQYNAFSRDAEYFTFRLADSSNENRVSLIHALELSGSTVM